MKGWTFEVYLITGELSSWFWMAESLKMTCARPYVWFLNFLSSRGLDCFLQPNVLRKLSKINCGLANDNKMKIGTILTCPNQQNDYQLWTAQCQQNDQFENLNLSSHGVARNIKIGHLANLVQRVQLSPLPKEVVTSLPHNYKTLTNLFYL